MTKWKYHDLRETKELLGIHISHNCKDWLCFVVLWDDGVTMLHLPILRGLEGTKQGPIWILEQSSSMIQYSNQPNKDSASIGLYV